MLITFRLSAQNTVYQDGFQHTSYTHFLSTSFNGRLESDFLPNKGIYNVLSGGDINPNTQEQIAKNANKNNQLAFYAHTNINYSWSQDSCHSHWHVGLGFSNFAFVLLPQDAVKLITNGNQQFKGKWAKLDDIEVSEAQFTTLSIGKSVSHNRWQMLLGAEFLAGIQSIQIHSKRNRMYTSAIGDSVYFETEGNAYLSGKPQTGSAFNGYGLAFNALIRYQLKPRNALFFQVDRIGGLTWSAKSDAYDLNTSYLWTGFDVPDLFTNNDSLIKAQAPTEVFDDITDNVKNQRYSQALWGNLFAGYEREVANGRVQVGGGLHLINQLRTQAFAHYYHHTEGNKWTWDVRAQIGGLQPFAVGGGFAYQWKNNSVQFQTFDLHALLLPQRFGALSTYFKFTTAW